MTPVNHTILEEPGQFIIYDKELLSEPRARLFDPGDWGDRARAHTEGRGTVWFVDSARGHWVLKAFQRGGLIGRWIKRRYVFLGYQRARMVREFQLLGRLRQMGLPVPQPVAAFTKREALFWYSGSLITQRLENVRSLASCLSKNQLVNDHTWHQIGRTIRRFHDCNVFHSDLNASNILLDDHSVYLIDFDRSQVRSSGFPTNWRRANLKRLRRSLDKCGATTRFNCAQSWEALCAGYENLPIS